LTEQMHRLTRVRKWPGIDPTLTEETVTDSGCTLRPGRASQLGFPDEAFDVAVFANVFEHIPPSDPGSPHGTAYTAYSHTALTNKYALANGR
jgi:hypothetical protein